MLETLEFHGRVKMAEIVGKFSIVAVAYLSNAGIDAFSTVLVFSNRTPWMSQSRVVQVFAESAAVSSAEALLAAEEWAEKHSKEP